MLHLYCKSTKKILADPKEKIYSKCQAIEFSIRLFLTDILKPRNVLDLLLDSWVQTSNIHIETLRIKRLALLYPYEYDIQLTLSKLADNDSLVKTECNFQLGLMDAMLFKNITNAIIYIFCNNWLEFNKCKKKLERLIFIQQAYTWEPTELTLYFSLYSKLCNTKEIVQKDVNKWLNYKAEFNQLCLDFFKIQNQTIKSDLFTASIETSISNKIISEIIEPVFKTNYRSTLCKIDCMLDQNDINEEQSEFLKYLKDIILRKSSNESSDYHFLAKSIKEKFPHISESEIEKFCDAIVNNNLQTISNSLEQLGHDGGYETLLGV